MTVMNLPRGGEAAKVLHWRKKLWFWAFSDVKMKMQASVDQGLPRNLMGPFLGLYGDNFSAREYKNLVETVSWFSKCKYFKMTAWIPSEAQNRVKSQQIKNARRPKLAS